MTRRKSYELSEGKGPSMWRTLEDKDRDFDERQKLADWAYLEDDDTLLGQQVTPLDRVGLYVPGGKAAYPSSVLMNAIPAKVAMLISLERSIFWEICRQVTCEISCARIPASSSSLSIAAISPE